MSLVLLRTLIATLIAFAGGALGVALGGIAVRRLQVLVSAAMGVLLAVNVCDVLPDAKALLTWPLFAAAVASGYGLFWLISKWISPICPSCAFSTFDAEATRRLGQTAALLMLALGVHSTMDGVAVAVGDAMAGRPNLGLMLAVSCHKLPEGMALAVLLLGAGYPRRTVLWWTLGVESATVLGGWLGVLALHGAPRVALGLVFAHVGGGFLYLVAGALSLFDGHGARERRGRRPRFLLLASSGLAFALTAAALWTLARVAP